ncbi:MAG: DUF4390 domain-containing protein [Betaproteobacteria bacterium]|jgi:Domain of unknown function (DUF4390)|nr:DUF4390 domain-containing protein [Betaproteobacteria bacterium]
MPLCAGLTVPTRPPEAWLRWRLRALGRVLASVWLWALVALAMPGLALANDGGAEVGPLRFDREDGQLLLSTQVNLQLSPEVSEALLKGIAITFVAEAELARNRWYWYDKPLVTAVRYMRLSYQPLTRRWRLVVSAQPFSQQASTAALGQNFDALEDALGALRRISRWRIAALSELDPDAQHNVTLRFRLDQASLPRPFQLGTVTLEQWRIGASRNQKVPD